MRKSISLVFILFLSNTMFGQNSSDITPDTLIIYRNKNLPSDKFIEKEIVGKWKDENSTLTFYKNNTYLLYFDTGEKEEGFWEINNGLLTFELFIPSGLIRLRGLKEVYVISDFNRNSMIYINPKDKILWHASKIIEVK